MTELLGSDTTLVVVGRLCSNPTTTTGSFPHGGTPMGAALVCEWMPEQAVFGLPAEDYGGERVEQIKAYEEGLLAVVFAGMPNEAVRRVFANSAVGASGARTGGYGRPDDDSKLASDSEFTLLFSPRSSEHPKHIIHRAYATWQESAVMQLFVDNDLGLAVAFRGFREATKGMYDWFKASDISA